MKAATFRFLINRIPVCGSKGFVCSKNQ